MHRLIPQISLTTETSCSELLCGSSYKFHTDFAQVSGLTNEVVARSITSETVEILDMIAVEPVERSPLHTDTLSSALSFLLSSNNLKITFATCETVA